MTSRALIVDDNATVRLMLRFLLEDLSFDVVDAADGIHALDLARTGFDLVLTDLEMPRMDGFELVGKLRAMPSMAQACIVVVTGHVNSRIKVDAIRAGADLCLGKDLDQGLLTQAARIARDRNGCLLSPEPPAMAGN